MTYRKKPFNLKVLTINFHLLQSHPVINKTSDFVQVPLIPQIFKIFSKTKTVIVPNVVFSGLQLYRSRKILTFRL